MGIGAAIGGLCGWWAHKKNPPLGCLAGVFLGGTLIGIIFLLVICKNFGEVPHPVTGTIEGIEFAGNIVTNA